MNKIAIIVLALGIITLSIALLAVIDRIRNIEEKINDEFKEEEKKS